ncbi:MAG: hypothetical protein PHQ40_03875, partial [Anaerolineaceae bacterium]|nr:hypothetical protein [Anaerolineaceae bacterium]
TNQAGMGVMADRRDYQEKTAEQPGGRGVSLQGPRAGMPGLQIKLVWGSWPTGETTRKKQQSSPGVEESHSKDPGQGCPGYKSGWDEGFCSVAWRSRQITRADEMKRKDPE